MAPGGDSYYEWDRSFSWSPTWYGRTYVWFDALSAGDVRLVRVRGGGALRLAIDVMRNGRLRLKDANNVTIGMTTSSILTKGWVRIEWMVDQSTGTVELRLFNSPNTTTPTETLRTASGVAIGAFTDAVQIGRSGSQSFASTFWTDDPGIRVGGYLGPVA